MTCVANLPPPFATCAPIRSARSTKTGPPCAPPWTGAPTAVSTTRGQSRRQALRPRAPSRSPGGPRAGGGGGAGGGSRRANSTWCGEARAARPACPGWAELVGSGPGQSRDRSSGLSGRRASPLSHRQPRCVGTDCLGHRAQSTWDRRPGLHSITAT